MPEETPTAPAHTVHIQPTPNRLHGAECREVFVLEGPEFGELLHYELLPADVAARVTGFDAARQELTYAVPEAPCSE